MTLSLRTQQIIALETGVTRTVDPLAGSYYVEHLTDEIERRAHDLLGEVAAAGGMVAALDAGLPQRWIADSAYQIERDLAEGRRLKVGVNIHRDDEPSPQLNLFEVDGSAAPRQVERLRESVRRRDRAAHAAAMHRLRSDTTDGRNVMPALIDATRAGATVGEMAGVFRDVFGEFREPRVW